MTDTFAEFEFDSSGPIHNLQIVFLAMLVLAALSLVFLLLKILFLKSKKVSKCVDYVHSKLYFNVYIRFGLEAYLLLCLSSMIRLENYKLDDSSERFHSSFALTILFGLLVYLCFSLLFLQINFPNLKSDRMSKRYGDLYLGLQTRERAALLFPFVFMLRRLLYTGILVLWSGRNYFQIQTIIFKCSLVMIFTG